MIDFLEKSVKQFVVALQPFVEHATLLYLKCEVI